MYFLLKIENMTQIQQRRTGELQVSEGNRNHEQSPGESAQEPFWEGFDDLM